jgi:hypothetical protein
MVTATVLHLAADGIYDIVDTGSVDGEWADVTGTGIYDLVVAGTAPSAPRIRSCRIGGGSNVILY